MLSVLLVEPHPDTRDLYGEWLELAGMRVLRAANVEHARVLVPLADVIVTETQLPGTTDAFTFIAELRSNATTSHIPIVVVSASGAFAEAEARAAGCDLYLAKPCLPEQLQLELVGLDRCGGRHHMARAVDGTHKISDRLKRLG